MANLATANRKSNRSCAKLFVELGDDSMVPMLPFVAQQLVVAVLDRVGTGFHHGRRYGLCRGETQFRNHFACISSAPKTTTILAPLEILNEDVELLPP